jgi:6-phosphofructokinase 1
MPGRLLAEAGTRDAFGHAQLGGVGPLIATLVKDKLGHNITGRWPITSSAPRAT